MTDIKPEDILNRFYDELKNANVDIFDGVPMDDIDEIYLRLKEEIESYNREPDPCEYAGDEIICVYPYAKYRHCSMNTTSIDRCEYRKKNR